MMNSAAGLGSTEIPFAQATAVEIQDMEPFPREAAPYVSSPAPKTSSYSSGASNIAVATGAPIIRSSNQPSTVSAPQQRSRRSEQPGCCCNGHTCCCVTSVIFTIIFLCCILPFLIMLIVAVAGASRIEAMLDDDVWREIDQGYGN